MDQPAAARPKRKGCGCLGGLTALAVAGIAAYSIWFALTAPWIYTVGRFRPYPLWEGRALVDGPGGTYRLFIALSPDNDNPTSQPATWAHGKGWICGPKGQHWPVNAGGVAPAVVWKNMNGQRYHLYLRGQGSVADSLGGIAGQPTLDFFGAWQGNRIVTRDQGGIDRAFTTEGALRTHPGDGGSDRSVVFDEWFWGFGKPC